MWSALTGVAMVVIATIIIGLIYLLGQTLSFLQPLLLPVAVAGVLAYLLEPVVAWLVRRKIPRTRAVFLVFASVIISGVLILIWVIPALYEQGERLGSDIPGYTVKVRTLLEHLATKYESKIPQIGPFKHPVPATPASDSTVVAPTPGNPPPGELAKALFGPESQKWMQQQIPTITAKAWAVVQGSIGGFLGVFGFVLGLFIVPVYLFFFLKDADNIAKNWSGYLPLRASHFKDEVVIVLEQINGYLIAFFRGQLIVSFIDGAMTGTTLLIMGLPFALLIGLMVCFLCIIPYLGIVICWLPAVLIAAVEFKDWQHPLAVTVIFIAVQQIEGIFISPKIVGDSVGLHPMTIIVSVFAWSLLLGGLLGAILAIPLTATLKVLLTRYVWQKRREERAIIVSEGPLDLP